MASSSDGGGVGVAVGAAAVVGAVSVVRAGVGLADVAAGFVGEGAGVSLGLVWPDNGVLVGAGVAALLALVSGSRPAGAGSDPTQASATSIAAAVNSDASGFFICILSGGVRCLGTG